MSILAIYKFAFITRLIWLISPESYKTMRIDRSQQQMCTYRRSRGSIFQVNGPDYCKFSQRLTSFPVKYFVLKRRELSRVAVIKWTLFIKKENRSLSECDNLLFTGWTWFSKSTFSVEFESCRVKVVSQLIFH